MKNLNTGHWDLKINGRILVNDGLNDFSNIQQLLGRIAKDKQVVSCDFGSENNESRIIVALKEAIGGNGEVKLVKFSDLRVALGEADVVVLNPDIKIKKYFDAMKELGPDLEQFIQDGKNIDC